MLSLEPRLAPSRAMVWLSPLLAVALMVAGGMLLFRCLGQNPLAACRVVFLDPIQDRYGLAELLLKATPLMLCAIGLAVGFRANVWNIGADGQFLLGAVAGGGLALQVPEGGGRWLLPAMMVAGALGGMAWAAIPALLRVRFKANEILTSLMLVYVAELLVSWLVHGPWKDPDGFNFPQTRLFQAGASLPVLVAGTRLNAALVIALAALVAAWVFLNHSHLGFQMKVTGQAEPASRYAGISGSRSVWLGLLAGGGMAGIAGVAEVAGPVGQLTEHISPGYGIAAMIVALMGRLNPIGIFFSSLLMALLYLGGEQAQLQLNLPYSLARVLQGMLLLFLLGSDLFIRFRPRWTGWKARP